MKQKILIILIVAVMLAMILPLASPAPSEAASYGNGYVSYVVRSGDHLADIARRYCTTWQEIYYLNRNVIGPDPDHLVPGMTLIVPARCGGGYVYDRGWLPHAQGHVIPPSQYWVIRGDTWYSIGKRFGVSVQALRQANGQYYPYAYTPVIIPGLNAGPIPPPVWPTPTPPPPLPAAHISITSPPANVILPATFTVSGQGGNLPEANVVVRVKNQSGAVIAEQATVLQGPDVGTGGEGSWSVQFTVNEPSGSSGTIEASSPGTSAFASIIVFFGNGGNVDYPPGQCQIHVRANEPGYDQPNGRVLGIFPSPTTLEAQHRERVNNVDWYRASVTIDNVITPVWVPATSLDSVSNGC
jgi:LysM repeat protein